MIRTEAERLVAAIDREIGITEGERPTGATADQLELARRLVAWIAEEAIAGRRPDQSPTFGTLGWLVVDGFDPRSPLGNDLIAFERSVGEALVRGSRDIARR